MPFSPRRLAELPSEAAARFLVAAVQRAIVHRRDGVADRQPPVGDVGRDLGARPSFLEGRAGGTSAWVVRVVDERAGDQIGGSLPPRYRERPKPKAGLANLNTTVLVW